MTFFPSLNFVFKGLIFPVFIWLGGTSLVHAQEFSLGLKAGPLASRSFYGDRDDGKDFKSKITAGYYAAGIIGFPLKNNYSCILEGGYSQHGRHVVFDNGYSRNRSTYYFTDAVLLLRKSFNFELGPNMPSKWFFNIGPHVNYWLGGKGRIGPVANDGSAYTVVFHQEPDLGQFDKMYLNGINRWLFGLDLGVGVEAPIKKTQHVLVELRFTSGHTFYGRRNSATYSWVGFEENLRANEKVLSLTVAYTFDFNLQEAKKGKSTKDKEVNRKPVKKKKYGKRKR